MNPRDKGLGVVCYGDFFVTISSNEPVFPIGPRRGLTMRRILITAVLAVLPVHAASTSYTFEDVRPGSYKVLAIESWLYDPYQGAYLNAAHLTKYEDLGIPVTVRDGGMVNVRLNLAPR